MAALKNNFVMHMWTSTAARRSDLSYFLTQPNLLPTAHIYLPQMSVTGAYAKPMIDLDKPAIAAFPAAVDDFTFGRGKYNGPAWRRKIRALVHRPSLVYRVAPPAKATANAIMIERRNKRQTSLEFMQILPVQKVTVESRLAFIQNRAQSGRGDKRAANAMNLRIYSAKQVLNVQSGFRNYAFDFFDIGYCPAGNFEKRRLMRIAEQRNSFFHLSDLFLKSIVLSPKLTAFKNCC